MFKAIVLTSRYTLFEGEIERAFMPGDTGEFEVLEFHKPMVSLLKEGIIVFDRTKTLAISKGIVRMNNNELVAIVEQ